jgi:hypothetical protein
MPPPIVAHALGYSAEVTEERAEDAGRTWLTTLRHQLLTPSSAR